MIESCEFPSAVVSEFSADKTLWIKLYGSGVQEEVKVDQKVLKKYPPDSYPPYVL